MGPYPNSHVFEYILLSLIGTASADILDRRAGNDRIQGRAGNDLLKGSEGNDSLYGESGNDTLQGGIGNDVLLGSSGTDTLVGGSGADQFIFDMNAVFQSTIGVDVIQDFLAGTDRLVLDQTTFTALGSTVSFATVTTLANAQTSPALITYIAATGAVYYNANGRSAGFGTGGQFADLSDGLTLAASNFLIRS